MRIPRILSTLAVAAFLAGCYGTVTPKIPTASQASFDGTNQNSGFAGFDAATGMGVLTANKRAEYNALIVVYGSKFVPPLKADDGISTANGTFQIDSQHLADLIEMLRWKREGK